MTHSKTMTTLLAKQNFPVYSPIYNSDRFIFPIGLVTEWKPGET